MDTSETYIKMCEGAEEIQNLMPNGKDADHFEQACFYYNPKGGTAVLEYPDFPDGRIWLPRQDQLQEMVNLKIHASWLLLSSFIGWYINEYNESYDWPVDWDSWEKTWLAFVMSEKHGKVWDGKKWIARTPAKIGI